MTDENTEPTAEEPPAEPGRRVLDDIRAHLQTWGEELKQQLAAAIDQKLDELGARIGQM